MRLTWSLGIAAAALVACSTHEPGDGSWTRPGEPGPVDRSRGCLASQRGEVAPLTHDLQRVVGAVLREPDEPQQETATRVRWIVHRTERRLRRCEDRTDLSRLVEVVDTRVGDARDALDEPTLRLVVGAFRDWARAVGAARQAILYYHRSPCVLFRRGVEVSIEVERQVSATGPTARVVLVVDNDLREAVYVEHGGRVRVEGLAPDGRTRVLDWGGSSSDTSVARAGGTSRSPIWPVPLRSVDVPLVPGASLEVFDVYASTYSSISCRTPIDLPRAS